MRIERWGRLTTYNTVRLRIKKAGFPELTSLENFDWTFNPEIGEAKIRELSELKFIEEN